MLRGKLLGVLALAVATCLMASCGSTISTTTTTPDHGGLTLFISDSPACDVLSYRTVVTQVVLVAAGAGNNTAVFKGAGGAFVRVNFGELRDMTTILQSGTVPVGTYNQAQISFGSTTFTSFNPTLNPQTQLIFPTFSDTTRTFSIQPPLTVVKGGIYGLRLDFDLRHSIGVDAQGNLTGTVPPQMAISTLTADPVNGFGRLQDMRGFVLSVTNGSKLTEFIGALNVQILSGSASVPVLPVNISADTLINGVPATSQAVAAILGGSFLEMDAYQDPQGNLVARSVQVEDQANVSENRLGLIGYVTSLARDASGNVTQFNLFVADEQPESTILMSLDAVTEVDVSSTTQFKYSSPAINFASLPFDATSLQVGQEVVVHGQVIRGNGGKSTVTANSVYLLVQAHEGNYSSTVQAGSDDRTGAFWFKPCAAIFQGVPVLVFTNSDTAFVNLAGLSALTPQPSLLIKGLVFYELQGGTVSGVTVPPDTLVMLADQVHQLP